MNIKSATEIQSLDDELDLFNEQDWGFMSAVSEQMNNYEYFNDIRDRDFDKVRWGKLRDYAVQLSMMLIVMVVCIFVSARMFTNSDNEEYRQIALIDSVVASGRVAYVDGVEVSSAELIEASGVVNKYFACLKMSSDYSDLYNYCDETSVFADTYYLATDKVQTLYDENDCYARFMRTFTGLYTLNRVNKVIENNGIYYCYIDLSAPSINDMYEYVYMYQYNFVKEFKGGVVTEADIAKYLLENMRDNKVPSSHSEVCIKMVKDGGSYRIVDDSFISNSCIEAYTTAVNQVSLILGAGVNM